MRTVSAVSSGLLPSPAMGTWTHPSFSTTRSRIVTVSPGAASTTRAPSRSRLSMTTPDPFTTNVDRDEIFTRSGNGNRALSSPGQHANSGDTTMAGPGTTSIPLYATGSASATVQPRLRRKIRGAVYWSASPVAAVPGGVPLAWRAAPSVTAFLTGLKQMLASAWVNPTWVDSLAFRTVGNSCIMHSSRVGFLKTVLVLSLYLGLTKSGMTPWVRSRTLL
mmetsp:Transcript_9379/g.22795  ORF Transcript_9379/g.22795 Transcript_9379/m.22795 type:complete len:220 (-) Transcript_9379:82-741(-)